MTNRLTMVARLAIGVALLSVCGVYAADDIVLADFEGTDYGTWQAAGTAFGTGPAHGTLPNQQAVSGFVGTGLVNTYIDGDSSTGTLTSAPFKVQRKYINFLVGGGNHPDETCINLILDGKIVRTRTGPDNERLEGESWDVGDLSGKEVRIQIVDRNTGGWGHINIDQITQSDKRANMTATNLRREIEISQRYINVPVKNGAEMRRMKLTVDGKAIRAFDIELAEGSADFCAFIDVGEWKGKTVTIEVNKGPEDSWGMKSINQSEEAVGDDMLYKEPLRPQFHFTQKRGWNNDPNGMVYYKGEWHLYYQHNPYGIKWGNMHWGHAVSKDLVHWQELPIALYPWTQAKDHCFSGSAAVDENNTSGFQTGKEKVLVAAFTDTGCGEAIAYSNDRGLTWTYWPENPVVKHGGRDPRIFWYAPGKHWVMAVYDDTGGNKIAIYTSPDLKAWTVQSTVPDFFECPDLFELPVDGAPGKSRWVLFAADGHYVIGTFDGKTFKREHEGKRQVHFGNYYASQTFNNAPDGRRIQIGWGRIDMPGMPFNQMMTFPCDLTLRTTPDGIRMFAKPIKEIEKLHGKKHTAADVAVQPDKPFAVQVSGRLLDIRAEFEVGNAKACGLKVFGRTVNYDAVAGTLEGAPLAPVAGKIRMQVLVDVPSIEICGNDGRVMITAPFAGDQKSQAVEAWSTGGSAKLSTLEVNEMKSIWGTP